MVDRNPASRWDEDTEIHGLTQYDINREPRKLSIIGNRSSTINIPNDVIESLLSENLKCSVCLGMLEATLATTCLHRFCSECLQRSLRMDLGPKMHHECPSCRAKLASRRASKPDSKFDKLVQIFTGMKRTIEEMEDAGVQGDGKGSTDGDGRYSPRGTNSSSPRGEEVVDLKKYRDLHKQNVVKLREIRAQKLLASNSKGGAGGKSRKAMNAGYLDLQQNIKRTGSTGNAKNAEASQNKVWLKLSPVPEWSPEPALLQQGHDPSALARSGKAFELAHPFLRVPAYKSVLSLKTYLLQKFRLAAEQVAVEVCGMFKNKMTVLDEALTVLDMTTKAWDAQSELVLYFRLKPSAAAGSAGRGAKA